MFILEMARNGMAVAARHAATETAAASRRLQRGLPQNRSIALRNYFALRSSFRLSKTDGLFPAICPSVGHPSICPQSAQVASFFSRTQ